MVGVPKFSLVPCANVVPEIVQDSGHTVSLRVFYHDYTSLMFSSSSSVPTPSVTVSTQYRLGQDAGFSKNVRKGFRAPARKSGAPD